MPSTLASGQMARDKAIGVPSDGTQPIQAAHISIIHAICAVLEERFA